jgi:hypothetical protein
MRTRSNLVQHTDLSASGARSFSSSLILLPVAFKAVHQVISVP